MPNIVEILIDAKDISGEAVTKARENLHGLGEEGASAFQKLEKLGTLAIGAGLGAAVGGIVESVHAYAQLGEETLKLQRITGGTAEEVSRLAFAAKESGVEVDSLQKGLQIFSRNLTVAQEHSLGFTSSASTFEKAITSLDVALKNADGSARPTIDIFTDLADRLKQIDDPATRAGVAMQVFGKNGAALLPLLMQGSEGIAELSAEADKLGVTMGQKDVDAAHEFTLANRQLEEALKGVEIGVAQKVVPSLTMLGRALTEGMSSGQKFQDFMKGAAFALAAAWADAMQFIANQMISTLERVLNLWRDGLSKISGDVKVLGHNINPLAGIDTSHVSLGRLDDYADPLQALKKLFPDITKPVKDLGDKSSDTAAAMDPLPQKIKDTRTSLDLLDTGLKLTDQAAKDLFSKPTIERAQENLHIDSLNASLDVLKDKLQPNLDKLSDFKDSLSAAKDKLDAWGDDLNNRKGQISDAEQAVKDHIDALNTAKGDLTKQNDPAGIKGAQIDQAIAIDNRRIKGMEQAAKVLDKEEAQRQKQLKLLDDQGKAADRQSSAIDKQITLAERQVGALQRQTKIEDDRQKIMEDDLTLANQTLLSKKQQDALFTQLITDTRNVTGRIADAANSMKTYLIPSIDQVHQIATKAGDVLQVIRNVTAKQDAASASIDRMSAAADGAAARLSKIPGAAIGQPAYTDKQGVLRGGGPQSIKPPDVGDAGLQMRSRGYAN